MTPVEQVIFWARHGRDEEAIYSEARKMAAMYRETPDDWFPWCVAAERQLTAQRIAAERHRVWMKVPLETIRFTRELAGNTVDNDDQKA